MSQKLKKDNDYEVRFTIKDENNEVIPLANFSSKEVELKDQAGSVIRTLTTS